MGRVDTNGSQYHQGLQPEVVHDHQPNEDLYEPPGDYIKPSAAESDEPKTQQFPPKHDEDEGSTQVFPPPYDHNDQANYTYDNVHQQQQPNINVGFNNNNVQPQQNHFAHQSAGGIPFSGISSSPAPLMINQQLPTQAWKSDLFDCCSDPSNAFITLCFPCITFGQIAEILDQGSTSCGTSGLFYALLQCCFGIPCILSCSYRSKMRSRFGLIESPCADCLVHCCCEYCALCQEYRELKERGFDPSIGYLGNLAMQQKQQQQFGMTPPMQQRMM